LIGWGENHNTDRETGEPQITPASIEKGRKNTSTSKGKEKPNCRSQEGSREKREEVTSCCKNQTF